MKKDEHSKKIINIVDYKQKKEKEGVENQDDRLLENINNGIAAMIEKVEFDIYKGNIEEAENILLGLLERINDFEKYESWEGDNSIIYCEFREPFEEPLYKMRFKPKQELVERPVKCGEVYFYYGYLLIEKGEIKEARKALQRAVEYAPVNAKYLNEYGETYKIEYTKTGDKKALKSFFENSKMVMKIAYRLDELARCYRNFAYYFVENELYDEAVICHMLASPYTDDHTIMQSELFYIKEHCENVNMNPCISEVKNFCKKYDIPEKCDPEIQELADDGIYFIINEKVDKELKEYYSDVLWPLVSEKMETFIRKATIVMSIEKKNNEAKKKHKTYTLNEISKVKTIKEYKEKNRDIDKIDTVVFGKYEQNESKKTDIEWLVLERDGDKVLLMSKYILECKKYDEKENCITWEKCSLRKWLNKNFYDKAFSKNEQKQILEVTLKNDFNNKWEFTLGNDTSDKIFCLSTFEIEKYYKDEKVSKEYYKNTYLATRATIYVVDNSNIFVNIENDKTYVDNSYFWTRSVSNVINEPPRVMPVNDDGIIACGVPSNEDFVGVRPIMWVKCE